MMGRCNGNICDNLSLHVAVLGNRNSLYPDCLDDVTGLVLIGINMVAV